MNWLIYLLFVLFLLVLLYLLWTWKTRKQWSEKDRKFFVFSWKKIIELPDHRLQLMEADKLFDHMMKKRGYQGSLGEKLKRHGDIFQDLNGLWAAHKLRNRMAHEMDVRISRQEVEKALKAFKKAFDDLGLNAK